MPKLEPIIKPVERENLALNLQDLDRLDPRMRARIAAMLDPTRPIKMGVVGGKPEVGVEFSCNLLTAALTCDVLRSHDREAGDRPIKIYLRSRGEAWGLVPADKPLTVLLGGKAHLSPAAFQNQKTVINVSTIAPEAINLGE